jgi:hypothetical protein
MNSSAAASLPRISSNLSRRSPQDHDRAMSALNSFHHGITGVVKLRAELEEAARGAFAAMDRADLFLKRDRRTGARRTLSVGCLTRTAATQLAASSASKPDFATQGQRRTTGAPLKCGALVPKYHPAGW